MSHSYIPDICEYLTEQNFSWEVDDNIIITSHEINSTVIKLAGVLDENFPYSLPKFYLKDRKKHGLLAHVDWNHKNDDGSICVGHRDSISCDFDYPDVLYHKALESSLNLVKKALTDITYNDEEVYNEYEAHWACSAYSKDLPLLCLAPPETGVTDLIIRSSIKALPGLGLLEIVLPKTGIECNDEFSILQSAKSKKRQNLYKSCSIEVPELILPPSPSEDIKDWWKNQLSSFDDDLRNELKEKARLVRSKEFFIILHSKRSSGTIWLSIKCSASKKQKVPLKIENIDNWNLRPIVVKSFSKEKILPRGGGKLDLQQKSVLIIGCGSLGGHVANMLSGSGIGMLHLSDPDIFNFENTYRHVLTPDQFGAYKTQALKNKFEQAYPYLNVKETHDEKSYLLQYKETKILEKYDLVIVAVGSPTDERAFNDYFTKSGVTTPIIYSWLEGYGVGGHAVLVEPAGDGCLSCCYIDNTSCEPCLSSNLSFIETEQVLFKNQGGCGSQFMPYSNIDAMQTATMTSRLALRSLNEEIENSVTVSWKGSSIVADEENITLSHRYTRFDKNLLEIPLNREECPICQG